MCVRLVSVQIVGRLPNTNINNLFVTEISGLEALAVILMVVLYANTSINDKEISIIPWQKRQSPRWPQLLLHEFVIYASMFRS